MLPPDDFYPEEQDVPSQQSPEQDNQQQNQPGGQHSQQDLHHPKEKTHQRPQNQQTRGSQSPSQRPGNQEPLNKLKDRLKERANPVQNLRRELRRGVQKQLKRGAQRTVAKLYKAPLRAVATPAGAIVAIVVILIMFFIALLIILFAGGGGDECDTPGPTPELMFNKSGPASVPNPGDPKKSDIRYTITASFPGQAQEITVVDPVPEGTTFVSATGKFTQQKSGDKVTGITWKATENGGIQNMSVTMVVRPTKPDSYALNKATGTVDGAQAGDTCCDENSGSSGGTAAGYVPPSTNTCGGKYPLSNPLHKNFGDPTCSFDKNKLHDLLKQKDPQNADWWFNKVISCESGYNPNAFLGAAVDPAGAWGLFQDGSSTPPGSPPPAPGKNGPNDRGDVNWEMQVGNAAGLLKSNGKGYWACAR